MKIVVSEIPEGGMWVDFQGSDFAWDGLKGLHVAHYPEGRFFIEKSGTTVFMKGHVTAELRLPCSRCLEQFSFPVDPDVQYTLQPRRPVLDREIELTPEDLEYAYYENDLIDLERLIEEPIVLSIPIKPLCDEGCLGICPTCGENRNLGQCECAARARETAFSVLKELLKDD
jgi:uncharacterized protein